MREFQKVSKEEFQKYYDLSLYDDYKLPERKTKNSAGYDFCSIDTITIKKGEKKLIPTGIKAKIQANEVLFLIVRSSLGVKHDIQLCNQVGVIDSDYYNNIENEGHIFICVKNQGEKDYILQKDYAYAQGIITNFLDCGETSNNTRVGGFGSTSKGGEEK